MTNLTPLPTSTATNAYDLLTDVITVMEEEPRRVDMGDYIYKQPPSDGGPACGTVGCIAGWITILQKNRAPRLKYRAIHHYAELVLGSSFNWSFVSTEDRMFYYDIQNLFSGDVYQNGKPLICEDPGYVKAVVERIRAFQERWRGRLCQTPVTIGKHLRARR